MVLRRTAHLLARFALLTAATAAFCATPIALRSSLRLVASAAQAQVSEGASRADTQPLADEGAVPIAGLETGDAGADRAPNSMGLSGNLDGATVTLDGGDIEIRMGDGTRIMLRGGYYSQIAPDGSIIVDHIASATEQWRVAALAREVSKAVGVAKGAVRRVEFINDDIRVTFADGHRQEISGSEFTQKNVRGEVMVTRPASVDDRRRLEEAAATLSQSIAFDLNPDGVIRIVVDGRDIEITYANLYVEKLEGAGLELTDPSGAMVSSRRATDEDRARLEAYYEK